MMYQSRRNNTCEETLTRGITFRDTGYSGPAVIVDSLKPGGAADASGLIEPGDILVRCTATTLMDSDVPIAIGDGPPPRTKHKRIEFNCLGENFDDVMAAVNSTGIVDTGFKHSKVRLEFMRDVTEDIGAFYGGGEQRRHHPKTYHRVEKDNDKKSEKANEVGLLKQKKRTPSGGGYDDGGYVARWSERVSAVDPKSGAEAIRDDEDTLPQWCKE